MRSFGDRHRGPVVLVGLALVLFAVDALTRQYPSHRGGLYLVWARAIAANGFVPPAVVDGYTTDPLPYAYPPLGLVVMAIPLALGVPDLLVLRLLPWLAFAAAVLGVYWFVDDRYDDRRAATLAAAFVLATPHVLYQSVVGAGVTRSLGLLFAIVGLGFVHRALDTPAGEWRQTAVAGVFFGLCLLTHYVYALLFVVGTLLAVAVEYRSVHGFVRGAGIAAVGAVVATPWYGVILTRHGTDTLLAPGGTYQNGLAPVPLRFVFKLLVQRVSPVGYLVVFGALLGAWLLHRRGRHYLPAVALVYGIVYPHNPSLYALLAILGGIGVADLTRALDAAPLTDRLPATVAVPSAVTLQRGALAVVLASTLLFGSAYLHADQQAVGSPPQLLDADTASAMEWANEETPPDATFLVGDRFGEWWPALADRPIAASQWGTEWVDSDVRDWHWWTLWSAYGCGGPDCYTDVRSTTGVTPDYVVARTNATERNAFEAASDYTVVYRSGDVVVVRVDDDTSTDSTVEFTSHSLPCTPGSKRSTPGEAGGDSRVGPRSLTEATLTISSRVSSKSDRGNR